MLGKVRDAAEHCVNLLTFLLVISLVSCSDGALAPKPTAGSATFELKPSHFTLTSLGDSIRLSATVRDATGKTIAGVRVSLHSSDEGIVAVTSAGSAIARAAGVALIIAAWETAVDTAVIEVRQEVASITLSPSSVSIGLGDSIRLAVTTLDATGHLIPGADVQWISSDPTVAALAPEGWVHARNPGEATITARAGLGLANALVSVAPGTQASVYSADAFVNSVGVNVHLSYLDRVYGTHYSSIIKPKVRELGIRHLRDGGNVWPDADWMQLVYGRYRDLAESAGVRFTIIMSPSGTSSGASRNYTDASHVRILLDRIGWNNVEAFEGLNEHDWSGSDGDWVTEVRSFQRALHAEIKKDPALAQRYAVLGPSLARADNARQVGDLTAWMDRAVMHPYPGGREPGHDFDYNLQALRVMNGNAPVVATETGYHTTAAASGGHPAVSERAMGKYAPRLFLEYFRAGVIRTFSYELIDQGADRSDMEQNFGLLHVDGTEKPAFRSLRNLIALLADPGLPHKTEMLSYGVQGDTTNIHRLLFQKRDGRYYVVLWQEVRSYDVERRMDLEPPGRPLTIRLAEPARNARVFAPMLGAQPLAEFQGTSVLSVLVQDHPLVIEIAR